MATTRKPKPDPDAPRALTKAERDEWNRRRTLRQPVDEVTVTPAQRRAFLELVKANKSVGTVTALRQVGVAGTRAQLAAHVHADEDLAAELRDARGYDDEKIRATLTMLGIDGVDEPVFGSLGEGSGTGIVGYKRVWQPRITALMAKAYLPEYRDLSRVEHTGPDGGAVPVEVNGGRVTGITDVFELARQLGVGLAQGLRGELEPRAARDALPAAAALRPDPPDG